MFYATSGTAAALLDRYRAVREQCLLPGVPTALDNATELAGVAARLRALSGSYDRAARAATSLWRTRRRTPATGEH